MGGLGALVFDTAPVIETAGALRGFVGVGFGYSLRGRSTNTSRIEIFGPAFMRVYSTITDRVDGLVNGPKIFGLRILHGFLPCPILYPAYLYALDTGSRSWHPEIPTAGGRGALMRSPFFRAYPWKELYETEP